MYTADNKMNMEAILVVMYTILAVVENKARKISAVVKIRFKSRIFTFALVAFITL